MKYSAIAAALLVPALLAGCSIHIDTSGISEATCAHANTYSESLPADGISIVRVNAWAGDLNVRAVEGATEVTVEAKACASDPKILESLDVKTRVNGDEVRVDVIHPNGITFGSGWVDLTIDLPPSLAAEISDTSGSTLIDGLAAVEISAGSGDLKVIRTTGTTEIREKSSGAISLERLKGDLILGDLGSGDLTVRDIQGHVELDGKSSGSARIEGLAQGLDLGHLGSGDLTVKGVGGDLSLTSKSSGTVVLTDISGKLEIGEVGSGDLRVKQVGGGLTLRSKSSGSVSVEEVGSHVLMESIGSGDLTVDGVKGDLVVRSKSSGSIRTNGVTGKVDVPRD